MFGALSEREFRHVFLANASSAFGDNVAPIALAFGVLDIRSSASALGLVLAARSVPFVVFLLVGGVWADRLPRQRVMVASDLLRCATQGLTAVFFIAGVARLWEVAALQALYGAGDAFYQPAATGLTPQTVSAARLQQANALLSLSWSTTGIAGPALAGLLVATVGPGWALAFDASTFAASAAFLLRVRLPHRAERVEGRSFLAEVVGGWKEVSSRVWLWVSIADFALYQLFVLATLFVLGPVIAKRSLGGAAAWALVIAAMGIGSLVGDFLGLRLEPRRVLLVAHLAAGMVAPLMILLGAGAPAAVSAVPAVLAGVAFSYSNTLWFTALQENVPEEAISRVSSYDWMGSTVLRPIGFALVGPIAARVGAGPTLIAAGVLTLSMQSVIAFLPGIRDLRRRAKTEIPSSKEAGSAAEPQLPES